MRSWSIEIYLLDDQGNEVMPTVFEKATYNLHPSFEKNKQGMRAMGRAGSGTYC
jgi:transcription initiation factor IIF auxiliary subunit